MECEQLGLRAVAAAARRPDGDRRGDVGGVGRRRELMLESIGVVGEVLVVPDPIGHVEPGQCRIADDGPRTCLHGLDDRAHATRGVGQQVDVGLRLDPGLGDRHGDPLGLLLAMRQRQVVGGGIDRHPCRDRQPKSGDATDVGDEETPPDGSLQLGQVDDAARRADHDLLRRIRLAGHDRGHAEQVLTGALNQRRLRRGDVDVLAAESLGEGLARHFARLREYLVCRRIHHAHSEILGEAPGAKTRHTSRRNRQRGPRVPWSWNSALLS